ncbi:MAG: MBL fold metallo-hydrolase [Alphaproteobacteria bacterium]|nr:MBL fold metallo-hydrolase [Alphaproteobacteria bacterium]
MSEAGPDFVFLPLGGSGEIGMNLTLYGYGEPGKRQWIILDCGVTFGREDDTPGIDLVLPDPQFIVARRKNLLGMVLTHGHEDHIGAVAHLWPELRCPIWTTPFTGALLRSKLEEADLLDDVTLNILPLGGTLSLGPFDLELITITHSIPEPNAVAVKTPLGTVLHTGDWKIDPDPLIGEATDEAALRALGDEGVLAIVCDSTNALVPGHSGSEGAVRESLTELIGTLKNRVAVTSFASNVARLETVMLAAKAHGREVALVGRSMFKIVAAARETGMLRGVPEPIAAADARFLPRDKVLYLCTGSQGEGAAALSRIAQGDHPEVTLEAGDAVIYSSRVIPGNDRAIFAVQNALAEKGVEVLTERDHFVHVSGHPCRDELSKMYQWVRPQIAIPVHGETRHLQSHAQLARDMQVKETVIARNGDMVRLAPGRARIIDEAPAGRLYVDGDLVLEDGEAVLRARRGLAFGGVVAATLVLDKRGRWAVDPVLQCEGVPAEIMEDLIDAAAEAAENLTQRQREDEAGASEAVRRAIRRAAKDLWGKRPVTRVQIVYI